VIVRKIKQSLKDENQEATVTDPNTFEKFDYKVFRFDEKSLYTREGYLEIYRYGGPDIVRAALEDLSVSNIFKVTF